MGNWVCSGIKDVVILRSNGQKEKPQNVLFLSIGKYICERSSKNFIGQVVDGQGDLIKVKFVRRKDLGSNSFKWPGKDDVDNGHGIQGECCQDRC